MSARSEAGVSRLEWFLYLSALLLVVAVLASGTVWPLAGLAGVWIAGQGRGRA